MAIQSTAFTGKLSLRKNDLVQVISGRDKGKSGKIVRVDHPGLRVYVEKLNLVKRHLKPTQQNPQGGIVEKEGALHAGKVLLMCPKCARGVRHGHKVEKKTGKDKAVTEAKVRFCKKCKTNLD